MSGFQNEKSAPASIADVPADQLPQIAFEFNAVTGSAKDFMRQVNADKRDMWMLSLDQINILEGFNPRIKNEEYEAHIENLTGLILAGGYNPGMPLSAIVLVKDGVQKTYVYDGHCRLEAVHRANSRGAEIKQLPVIVAPKGTSVQDLTAALVTTGTGKGLSPLEKAVVCKRLLGYNWTTQEIARRLNFTTTYVDQLLSVLQGPAEVQGMIERNEVSVSVALQAIKQHGVAAPKVLNQSLTEAIGKGKRKATGGMLPGTKFKKGLAKAAPRLYEVSCKLVRSDQFKTLPTDLQEEFMHLVEVLSQSQLELARAGDDGNGQEVPPVENPKGDENVQQETTRPVATAAEGDQGNEVAPVVCEEQVERTEIAPAVDGEASEGAFETSSEVRERDPDASDLFAHEEYLGQESMHQLPGESHELHQ